MDRIDVVFKSVLAATGAIFGYLFGGWTILLQILLTAVIIDYVSGMIASGVAGELSSKVGFRGIAKKVMIFLLVAVGNLIDKAMGEGSAVQTAIIFFYLGNEILSILENAGKIGLPIPQKLQDAVAILKGRGDENNG